MPQQTTGIIVVSLAFFTSSFGFQNAARASQDCFGALKPVLSIGHYSGNLDCDTLKIRSEFVGNILVGNITYAIYDVVYQTVPENGTIAHGGQRIIVVKGGDRYVGIIIWMRHCTK